ncbi:MAG: hypothetical protein NTW31_06615 [Bacteroidetes bacterium]|nr:hypothetical protein [Bacteroidota bacterium]
MRKPLNSGILSTGIILSVIILLAASAGCKKNTAKDLSPDLNVANDIVFTERGLFHTFNLLLKANLDSGIMHMGSGTIDKALVYYSSSSKRFTFYYQNKYCTDSVTRNGNILVTLTGSFFSSGTAATVVFQNYSEDSRKFIGRDNLYNSGMMIGGNGGYDSTIDSLIIVKDSVHSTLWNSQLVYHLPPVIKMQPDSLAPFTITGTANGRSSGTYSFSFQISTPLVNDIYCPWIRQGIMQLSVPSADVATGTIEYVNRDSCNNRVTYNFEGTEFEWWIIRKKLNY